MALARARTENIPHHWGFASTTKILFNGKPSTAATLGVINYQNAMYEMGLAIKIGAYVFCLERLTAQVRRAMVNAPQSDAWVIGAFTGKTHYSFVAFNDAPLMHNILVAWLVKNIWPILAPDEHKSMGDTPVISWDSSGQKTIMMAVPQTPQLPKPDS